MENGAPQLRDFRVLYQYNNSEERKRVEGKPDTVRTNFGPVFSFTTVMAPSAQQAADEITAIHAGYDENFAIVQVVEANGFVTGWTD